MIPSIVGSHVLELFATDPETAAEEAKTLPKLKITKVDLQWLQVCLELVTGATLSHSLSLNERSLIIEY